MQSSLLIIASIVLCVSQMMLAIDARNKHSKFPKNHLGKEIIPHRNEGLLPLATCGPVMPKDAIPTGNHTELNELPFMAALIAPGSNRTVCSGSLISERYVLTAASCFDELQGPFTVRLGEYDLDTDPDCQLALDEKSTYCTARMQSFEIPTGMSTVHNAYYEQKHLNDIALIRLPRAADLSVENVKPICLPLEVESRPIKNHPTQYRFAGWAQETNVTASTNLLQSKMPSVAHNYCTHRRLKHVYDDQLCAGPGLDVNSCVGEPGGPLFGGRNDDRLKTYLFGVRSYSAPDCSEKPTLFTNVGKFITWILDNIEE